MAITPTAAFPQKARSVAATVTGAIASEATDAPTNTVKLCDAGANGSRVVRLQALPRGTVGDASLVLYLSSDGGTTKLPIDSEKLGSQTPSATVEFAEKAFAGISRDDPLPLDVGQSLWVGSRVALAAGIVFAARVEDF